MDHRRPQYAAPPPPPSADPRAPQSQHVPYPHHQQPPQANTHPPPAHYQPYPGPPPPSGPPPLPNGPALPPIQSSYGPPGPAQDHQSLPSFRHPNQPPYDPRDGHEYQHYNRSGHATPAPVNRSYSQDSAHQRTPTTPAPTTAYHPASAHELPPPPHSMDHGAPHGYPPPPNGLSHGMPLVGPPPPPHHEQQPQYMTPTMDTHQGSYPPPQQQQSMYPPQYPGPVSNGQFQMARKKQMRATQVCTSIACACRRTNDETGLRTMSTEKTEM